VSVSVDFLLTCIIVDAEAAQTYGDLDRCAHSALSYVAWCVSACSAADVLAMAYGADLILRARACELADLAEIRSRFYLERRGPFIG
jgi:hypothetical protein